MNRRNIIICISVLAVLAVVVALAVTRLYSDSGSPDRGDSQNGDRAVASCGLLSAVPSDAAMVATFQRFKESVALLNDSTKVFGAVLSDSDKGSFRRFMSLLKDSSLDGISSSEAVVSMHNSGNLAPLLIVDEGRAPSDTSRGAAEVLAAADSAGLFSEILDCSLIAGKNSSLIKKSLLAVSSSEALLTALGRHIESDASILDRPLFPETVVSLDGKTSLFISHDRLGKLLSVFLGGKYSSCSSFLKKFSEWTGFTIEDSTPKMLSLSGKSLAIDDPSYFVNVLRKVSPGDVQTPEMLPSSTVYSVTLAFSDVVSYVSEYKKFIDAVRHLDAYKSTESSLRSSAGLTPQQWAERLSVKEVSRAMFRAADGFEEVILVRISKEDPEIILKGTSVRSMKEYKSAVAANPFAGFTGFLFGKEFSLPDETCMSYVNGWLVIGDENAVSEYVTGDALLKTLKSYVSDASLSSALPSKGLNFMAYYSVTENPQMGDEIFKKSLSEAVRKTTEGISYEPAILTASSSDGEVVLNLSVPRAEVVKSDAPAVEKDTTVVVPSGPFKVENSGTGRTNLFNQSKNMYLTLSEESGKGIWGVPFKTPICGRVETIDYYGNGKKQFLFASGSKLYLIDRLGRFVNPFPVDLGKDVLIGPAAYDFTGAHGYTVLVLHKDNTIEMYDLHARKPSAWKGITSAETIKGLPELLEVKGKKYWAVRTSLQTLVFPFYGGEALTKGTGGKSIRPDSPLEIKDNGSITVTCNDGKERNIKLE